MSAIFAGAGAQVQNMIRRAHDFGIVFDDKYGISDIAKPQQDLNQTLGIARMKPD
jgi:hypothetical protein